MLQLADHIIRKGRSVIRRPELLYNRAFGRLNYWPFTEISNPRSSRQVHLLLEPEIGAKDSVANGEPSEKIIMQNFRVIDAVGADTLDIAQLIKNRLYNEEEAQCYQYSNYRIYQ